MEIFKVEGIEKREKLCGSFNGTRRGWEFFRREKNLIKVSGEKNGFVFKGVENIGDRRPSFRSFVKVRMSVNTTQIPGSLGLQINFKKEEITCKGNGLDFDIRGKADP